MQFIWLASYPRSGSNFLRHVIEQVYGVRTWTRYSHDFYDDLFNDRMSSRLTKNKALKLNLPHYFLKTHAWAEEPDTSDKAILLVRDGRDVICSHARFELEYGYCKRLGVSYEKAQELLILGRVPLLTDNKRAWNWSLHGERWRERQARTILVRFEWLIKDPVATIIEAIDALQIGIKPKGEYCLIRKFEELQKQCPALFRKGKVGAWKDDMPQHLQDLFWEHHGREMSLLGYGGRDDG